jgi:hypothetical protein
VALGLYLRGVEGNQAQMERQMIYKVKFPCGHEQIINSAENEADAMSKAFMQATQPVYCRIHEGVAEYSSTPVGQMGYYYPPSAYPISASPMREVYMGGGYCVIPVKG